MFCRTVVTLALLLGCRDTVHCQPPTPVVSTPRGDIRGVTVPISSPTAVISTIFTFRGIPYAAPPVGNLRFRPPQAHNPWNNIYEATTFGPQCPQGARVPWAQRYPNASIMDEIYNPPNQRMDEDCLYLNVYTPALSGNSLPVMVWIHGGAFRVGSSDRLLGEVLSAHQNVTVVTINYRLGVLGFLTTPVGGAKGNFGFLDQVKALEWVHDNIANFGGDPDKVTIFGESAGSMSVSFLVLSPLADGLFRRAISESGTATSTVIVPSGNVVRTSAIGRFLNCTGDVDADMIDCMRSKSVASILAAQNAEFSVIAPAVVDEHFLPEPPKTLLQKGRFNKVDYILGTNNDELGFLLSVQQYPNLDNGMSMSTFTQQIAADIDATTFFMPDANKTATTQAILKEYRDPNTPDDPISVRDQYLQYGTDFLFAAPTVDVANAQSAQAVNVYQYEFQHRPSIYWWRPSFVKADHTDEIMFVLGVPVSGDRLGLDPQLFTEDEKTLSLDMMAYWANFARTGDPNDSEGAPTVRTLVSWPRYTPDSPAYLQLRSDPAVATALREDRMKFWNDVVPKLLAGDTTSPAAKLWGNSLTLSIGVCLAFRAALFYR